MHGVRLVPGRLYYFTIKSREINPLSPNSDQHQISPGKINVYSIPEVMRIKDTITKMNSLDILITSTQSAFIRKI